MNVCQHVSVLFLLLLATEQAGNGPPEDEEGGAFNLDETPRELEKIEQEDGPEQRSVKEGNFGERFIETSTCTQAESFDGLASKINPDSTLEEVNQELAKFCKKSYEDNPNAKLADVNDHALAALSLVGYLEGDIFLKIDGAIRGGHYAFLKCIYPATKVVWWSVDNLALLLAKAYGRTEWMSKEEWEKHGRNVDWKLRFRSLIRSGNENVYGDEEFSNLIFKNEIFKKNFVEIIQEAYDSGNTAFLKAIPYPSEDFPLDRLNAVFFWVLAYGQDWCSDEWNGYINTVNDIDYALKLSNIFKGGNPKVFEHERVKAFLKDQGIKEELEAAIEWDSLPFAQYLKTKHGEEDFKRMAKNCSKVHTRRKTFALYGQSAYNSYDKERLSRVYSFLLDNGKELDSSIIQFSDVPMLEKKHLLPLLESGFNRVPLSERDFNLYGTTETGIKFSKMVLNEQYKVGGKAWKEWKEWKEWKNWNNKEFETWGEAWSGALSNVELNTIDVESFKLINENLCAIAAGENPAIDDIAEDYFFMMRKGLYHKCMINAIHKGDIRFLIEAIIPTLAAIKRDDFTFDSIFLKVSFTHYCPIESVFIEATKGNFAILDWILDFKPELLEKLEWGNWKFYCSPHHVPFLKYLFEQSKEKGLPSYRYLANYAESHLWRAIGYGDFDHYDEVCGIKGVMEAMKKHGIEIPEFLGRR